MPVAEDKIRFRRDDIVDAAAKMARDPDKKRFPVEVYREWLREAYIYHLSILPLPLMKQTRQRADFSLPALVGGITSFFSVYFDTCGTDPEYQCSIIGADGIYGAQPHFVLRVVTVALESYICEFVKSEEEFIKGEASAYNKATATHPRCLITGNFLRVAPVSAGDTKGVLIYIARPFLYTDATMVAENYRLGLDAEASLLVAKYVACRKFEVDGEGQAYQMLHGEYNEELKNLMSMYGAQREDK